MFCPYRTRMVIWLSCGLGLVSKSNAMTRAKQYMKGKRKGNILNEKGERKYIKTNTGKEKHKSKQKKGK